MPMRLTAGRLDRGNPGGRGPLENLTSELMNLDDQATREQLKTITEFMLQVLRDIHELEGSFRDRLVGGMY
jgi:hypothetical protein